MIEGHIIADLGGLTDHHTHAMIDKQTATNLGRRMDLDPGQKTIEHREATCTAFMLALPQLMGNAMHEHGMDTWIGE